MTFGEQIEGVNDATGKEVSMMRCVYGDDPEGDVEQEIGDGILLMWS
jgi:hypothetical protein